MIKLSSNNTATFGSTFSSIDYKEFEKTGDSNYFESIIDNLILEEYSDSDEIKDLIKSLPKEEKRISIALNLGDNLLWNQINDVHKSDKTRYEKIKGITLLIRDYVKTADVRRKTHGEILTPFRELAKPMVNLIEEYDDYFWKDHTNKVLDSSAGYGTFLILCLFKFMDGLKEWEPNEDLRLKHIIENQLYYGELQSRSVFSWLLAIDPYDDYQPNIYWGSFLSEDFDYHMKNVWKVEKFDLIIQNPPYQLHKEGFKKSQPLWHLFVQKSLRLLKDDKYMIMVHPAGWRNIDGVFKETQNLLKKLQVLYLEIHNADDGFKIFGAATRYDFYCLKNTINNNNYTTIKGENGDIELLDISKMEFIPNGMFKDVFELVAKDDEDRVEVLYSRSAYGSDKNHMLKEKTEEFKYPCIQNVNVKNELSCIHHSNTKTNGHFGLPKVIFGRKSSGVFVDKNGDFGQAQDCSSIIDDLDNIENIQKALQNKRFLMLSKQCDVGGSRDWYNRKIIATFRKDFWKEFI